MNEELGPVFDALEEASVNTLLLAELLPLKWKLTEKGLWRTSTNIGIYFFVFRSVAKSYWFWQEINSVNDQKLDMGIAPTAKAAKQKCHEKFCKRLEPHLNFLRKPN